MMRDGSLMNSMAAEHCEAKDSRTPFDTSNGVEGATSETEWQFVVDPSAAGEYVERGGTFRAEHPDWCRMPTPLAVYKQTMETEINPRLEAAGQPPLTEEELVGGRCYTGPMCAAACAGPRVTGRRCSVSHAKPCRRTPSPAATRQTPQEPRSSEEDAYAN